MNILNLIVTPPAGTVHAGDEVPVIGAGVVGTATCLGPSGPWRISFLKSMESEDYFAVSTQTTRTATCVVVRRKTDFDADLQGYTPGIPVTILVVGA